MTAALTTAVLTVETLQDGGYPISLAVENGAGLTPLAEATDAALASALRGCTVKPVVVLSPPLPRAPVEQVRQLALRNEFAAELVASGCVHSVLALGLGGYERDVRPPWLP